MAFLQIEDFEGSLELIIFPKIWEDKSPYLYADVWEAPNDIVYRGWSSGQLLRISDLRAWHHRCLSPRLWLEVLGLI